MRKSQAARVLTVCGFDENEQRERRKTSLSLALSPPLFLSFPLKLKEPFLTGDVAVVDVDFGDERWGRFHERLHLLFEPVVVCSGRREKKKVRKKKRRRRRPSSNAFKLSRAAHTLLFFLF